MLPSSLTDRDEAETFDPLSSGAAAPPPVMGGGCLARFDPQSLTDESGADYTPDRDPN
ncbi:MAG: hypothetical protein JKY26_11215 [Pseudomonas sp.]|nr:hypothetical protein [Pseudomonas sp.]